MISLVIEEWKLSQIGIGFFGLVFKGERIKKNVNNDQDIPNTICIKKIIKKDYVEVEILQKISDLNQNERTIKYYGCGEDEEFFYLYMEYIESGSMADLIKEKMKKNSFFSDKEIIEFKYFVTTFFSSLSPLIIIELAKNIITGLKFIHDSQIIHRDIISETIQLVGNEIKFIDFGLSKFYDKADGSKYYSETGTDLYKAPEVKLQDNRAGRKSDIYSLGCVFIEMAGGDLRKRDDNGTPLIPDHLSYGFKNIIQHCLISNPDARYTTDQLYNKLFNIQPLTDVTYHLASGQLLELIPKDTTSLIIESSNGYFEGIPSTVTNLSLLSFNQEIGIDSIPLSVTYLDLGDEFDIQKNGDNLPTDTILTLRCGFNFTKILNLKSIPLSVTNLQLYNYNISLARNSIPKSVISLTLGSNFNEFDSLKHLPSSIINLTFGTKSNKEKLNDLLWGPTLNNNNSQSSICLNPSITSLMINSKEQRK